MKFVFIDTNMRHDDGSYYISNYDIKSKQLKVGDIVTAYQETDVWKGEIVLSENGYGIILKTDAIEISTERYEGHQEGFSLGVSTQREITLILLQNLNADIGLIEEIKRKFGM